MKAVCMLLAIIIIGGIVLAPIFPVRTLFVTRYMSLAQIYTMEERRGNCFIDSIIPK